jgi:hypothetical protein
LAADLTRMDADQESAKSAKSAARVKAATDGTDTHG